MTSASPSASSRTTRGGSQRAGGLADGGPPALPTPQSRPPAKPPDEDGAAAGGKRTSHAGKIRRALRFAGDDGDIPPPQQQQQQGAAGGPVPPLPLLALQLTHDGGSDAPSGESRGSDGSRGLFSAEAGSAAAMRLRRPWRPPRMGTAAAQAELQEGQPGGRTSAVSRPGRQATAAASLAAPKRGGKLLGGMSAVPLAGPSSAVERLGSQQQRQQQQQQPRRLAMGGPLVSRGRQAAAAAAAQQPQPSANGAVDRTLPDAADATAAAVPESSEELDDIEVALSDGEAHSASPAARQSAAAATPDQVIARFFRRTCSRMLFATMLQANGTFLSRCLSSLTIEDLQTSCGASASAEIGPLISVSPSMVHVLAGASARPCADGRQPAARGRQWQSQ